MEDFLVKRLNNIGEISDWYMYIGFKETPSNDHSMINCQGSALVKHDDKTQYWFNYSFHHSIDWTEMSGMVLTPNKKYRLSMEQITRVANDIYFNIREFISKMN